jgi:hypothetical protein
MAAVTKTNSALDLSVKSQQSGLIAWPGPGVLDADPGACRLHALGSSDAIVAGDACYIFSDGSVKRSSGAAANAAAKVDGFAMNTAPSGSAVALCFNCEMAYSTGLTPGTRYYLSGTVAGGLDTVASTGGTQPVAFATSTTEIYCFQSRY